MTRICGVLSVPQVWHIVLNLPYSSDGSVTRGEIGGVAPFSYLWETGDTTSSLSNMTAGYYSYTVTDAGGCYIIDSVLMEQQNNSMSVGYANNGNNSYDFFTIVGFSCTTNSTEWIVNGDTLIGDTVTYQFPQNGIFTICGYGCQQSGCFTITTGGPCDSLQANYLYNNRK